MTADDRLRRAWLWLAAAVGLHVFDEALTGFLPVYNATVLALRERIGWLPLPVFSFELWLGGLLAGIGLLVVLAPVVARGGGVGRGLALAFSVLMVANALGHVMGTVFGRTVDTVRFPRPMPGFWSSPFLLAAAGLTLRSILTQPGRREAM